MIPQLGPIGPGGPGLQVNTSVAPDRADTTGRGERAEPLTSGRTETARPALPPEAADRAREVARDPRPSLFAPDPNAPAGPPPSFEASILDRAREAALGALRLPDPLEAAVAEPTELLARLAAAPEGSTAAPTLAEDTPAPREATLSALRDPYAAPPSASERAETTVATLRRIETPYDSATVDVAR